MGLSTFTSANSGISDPPSSSQGFIIICLTLLVFVDATTASMQLKLKEKCGRRRWATLPAASQEFVCYLCLLSLFVFCLLSLFVFYFIFFCLFVCLFVICLRKSVEVVAGGGQPCLPPPGGKPVTLIIFSQRLLNKLLSGFCSQHFLPKESIHVYHRETCRERGNSFAICPSDYIFMAWIFGLKSKHLKGRFSQSVSN